MTGVKSEHPQYTHYAPKWKRCRDASAGQDAVHKAGETYLPKLKDQTSEDYAAYVKRAGFYGATWRTISGLVGMAFRKPPTVEVPASVAEYLTDVTMAGVDLNTFAQNALEDMLEVGRLGILVDHPPRPANVATITIATAQQMGLRPTMQLYPAESIINWRYTRRNNAWTLAMVVLKEQEFVADGEFGGKFEDRYRVLDIDATGYRQRVFRVDQDGKEEQIGGDVYPTKNGEPLDYIPFIMVGIDGKGGSIDEPPLIDLVDVNLSHYRTTADYEHGCHFTGLPTAVVSGYQPEDKKEKLYIGSAAAWVFPDPNAKASYLEFTGQGLTALKDNLDRKEQQMAVLGARMLAAEKRQAETATTAAIHRTGENSILSQIVIAASQALEYALQLFVEWSGQSGTVKFEINREFLPTLMDAPTLTALVNAVQAGRLSHHALFDLLQRGDVIAHDVTFEEEQGRIDTDGPPPPADTGLAA